MVTTGTLILIIISMLVFTSVQINAECCYAHNEYCKDCTMGTPFCGYGPCNEFGCQCRGGCRTGFCHG